MKVRKVKCAITGETGTSDTFVKIGTRYYKSQELYDELKLEKESYSKAKDLVFFELLGLTSEDKYPNFLTKMLREYEGYSNVVILRTLEENKEFMQRYLSSHEFNTVVGKIQFISAIMSNHIHDVKKKVQREKEEKRKILENSDEFEMAVGIMNDSIQPAPKQKVKNVTSFLEG